MQRFSAKLHCLILVFKDTYFILNLQFYLTLKSIINPTMFDIINILAIFV